MSVTDKAIYNHFKDPVSWYSKDANGRVEYQGFAEKETLPNEPGFKIYHFLYEGDSYDIGPVIPTTKYGAIWDDRVTEDYFPEGY